jgi:hypothetical protein
VSVTTAEELVGIIIADPRGTQQLLGLDDVTQLSSEAALVASLSSTPSLDKAPAEVFHTGAVPPAGEQLVEVGSSGIDVLASSDELLVAAGDPGTGVRFLECFGQVRAQGERGTCVAHAVGALAECLEQRAGNGVDLSEQFLYWSAKEHDGDAGSPGTLVAVAMARMVEEGTCREAVWPYDGGKIAGNEGQGPPPGDAAVDAAAHRLRAAEDLGRRDAAAIRTAPDERRPVALAIPIFPNWVGNPMIKLSGFIPMPLPGTTTRDGHAMCAVGYDYDAEFVGGGYLILRNSWGTTFAPRSPVAPGYALLPFAYWEGYGWEAFAGVR